MKVVEEENVPETTAVQKTMQGMISQDGATLLFPTSFGYFDPHILALAPKNPDVRFAHCGGLWTEGKHPKNAGSYFGYIDEAQYLNGVIAGHMTKSNKLGFVAAKPIPQVLRNINAFTLGARSVKPGITTHRDLHRRLVACRSRKPRPPTAWPTRASTSSRCTSTDRRWWSRPPPNAARWCAATTPSQAKLAPNAYLTGAEWNWITAYKTIIEAAQTGKPHPNFVRGGLKDGFVKSSPYGSMVTDAAKKNAEDVQRRDAQGQLRHLQGPAEGQHRQGGDRRPARPSSRPMSNWSR